jgi:hypothetical protein
VSNILKIILASAFVLYVAYLHACFVVWAIRQWKMGERSDPILVAAVYASILGAAAWISKARRPRG